MGRRVRSGKGLAVLTGIAAVILSVAGCGTTHYFVPPMPLEKSESAVFITWHYDLNGLFAPNPVPDVHLYWGLDENFTLGFGLEAPIFVSHVSVVKYWEAEDDFAYSFLHFGQVPGRNNNPLVEAGAGYALHQSSVSKQLEVGVA